MFYSYRKFNKSSKKGIYVLLAILLVIILWGFIAYKGVNIVPKEVTKELIISKMSYETRNLH